MHFYPRLLWNYPCFSGFVYTYTYIYIYIYIYAYIYICMYSVWLEMCLSELEEETIYTYIYIYINFKAINNVLDAKMVLKTHFIYIYFDTNRKLWKVHINALQSSFKHLNGFIYGNYKSWGLLNLKMSLTLSLIPYFVDLNMNLKSQKSSTLPRTLSLKYLMNDQTLFSSLLQSLFLVEITF